MDTDNLIEKFRTGERDALVRLIELHQKPALTVARSILQEAEEARDAVQDAFLQVFTNIDRFDRNRDFRKWVLSIVIKRCLDRLRRRKTYLRFLPRYLQYHDLSQSGQNPDSRQRFDSMLAKLNSRERAILTLHITEELPVNEIALIMNCAESTIRVHLFNARRKLKKEINRVSTV